jgi:hypothetical protein
MKRVMDSPSLVGELGAAGRRFAEGFTWERAASDTIRHIEETVTSPPMIST